MTEWNLRFRALRGGYDLGKFRLKLLRLYIFSSVIIIGALFFYFIKISGGAALEDVLKPIDEARGTITGQTAKTEGNAVNSQTAARDGIAPEDGNTFYSGIILPAGNADNDGQSQTDTNKTEQRAFPDIDASELDTFLRGYGDTYSVYYQNIETGCAYGYNADKVYYAASVIKAPYCLYIYKLAESSLADLSSVLTYNSGDYMEGAGVIQKMEVGTSFTEYDLLKYAIRNSDNIALRMLVNKYGTSGFKDFVAETGGNPDFITTVAGAKMTAEEAGRFAKEIYNYIEGDNMYSAIFKTDLMSTTNRLIVSDYPIARKYGWWDDAYHDMAIVYSPSPYILVIMSDTGYDINNAAFRDISRVVEKFNDANFPVD